MADPAFHLELVTRGYDPVGSESESGQQDEEDEEDMTSEVTSGDQSETDGGVTSEVSSADESEIDDDYKSSDLEDNLVSTVLTSPAASQMDSVAGPNQTPTAANPSPAAPEGDSQVDQASEAALVQADRTPQAEAGSPVAIESNSAADSTVHAPEAVVLQAGSTPPADSIPQAEAGSPAAVKSTSAEDAPTVDDSVTSTPAGGIPEESTTTGKSSVEEHLATAVGGAADSLSASNSDASQSKSSTQNNADTEQTHLTHTQKANRQNRRREKRRRAAKKQEEEAQPAQDASSKKSQERSRTLSPKSSQKSISPSPSQKEKQHQAQAGRAQQTRSAHSSSTAQKPSPGNKSKKSKSRTGKPLQMQLDAGSSTASPRPSSGAASPVPEQAAASTSSERSSSPGQPQQTQLDPKSSKVSSRSSSRVASPVPGGAASSMSSERGPAPQSPNGDSEQGEWLPAKKKTKAKKPPHTFILSVNTLRDRVYKAREKLIKETTMPSTLQDEAKIEKAREELHSAREKRDEKLKWLEELPGTEEDKKKITKAEDKVHKISCALRGKIESEYTESDQEELSSAMHAYTKAMKRAKMTKEERRAARQEKDEFFAKREFLKSIPWSQEKIDQLMQCEEDYKQLEDECEEQREHLPRRDYRKLQRKARDAFTKYQAMRREACRDRDRYRMLEKLERERDTSREDPSPQAKKRTNGRRCRQEEEQAGEQRLSRARSPRPEQDELTRKSPTADQPEHRGTSKLPFLAR